ncbi:hypothetical protein FJY84_07195 [Candidatus Bathyarchaeota archaeon]|nr:hypothetical protein [Candidatus Bathyarchaeota archaeon]
MLVCEGGLILIDLGINSDYFEVLNKKLKEINKTINDIKLILFTHLSKMQIETLEIFKKTCNPEIMMSYNDSKLLVKNCNIKADMELDDGDLIGACGGLEIIKVEYNKASILGFLLKDQKILLLGGGLTKTIFDNINNENPKNVKNLLKILKINFETILMSDGSRLRK